MTKIAVLGAGNELLGDEGVGVHAVRALGRVLPSSLTGVDLIEVGTSPDFGHLVEEADRLIILDAVKGGCEPGTVYRFTPDEIAAEARVTTSVHQMGILENLRMMELMGDKPKETVIIGVEPAEVGAGMNLSPELQKQVPRIVEIVQAEIGLFPGEGQTTNEARV